jgi:hypothetical protein
LIKIIATLCSLAAPSDCHDETVASIALASGSMLQSSCLVGMPELASWMSNYPDYRLKEWKCVVAEKREGI